MIHALKSIGVLAMACAIAACGGGGGGEEIGLPPAPAPVDPPVVAPVHPMFQPADAVIGQMTLTSVEPNRGGLPAANTLMSPHSAAVDEDGRLFIADAANNRILIFESVPDQNGAAAVRVLGQPDPNSNDGGLGQGRLNYPTNVATGAGKLAITDWANNRVLIYSTVPTESGALPDAVVGQQDFDSADEGCSESSLSGPIASTITPDGRLIVADLNNHRVLIWPIGEHEGLPEFILGQEDADHCSHGDEDFDGLPDSNPDARFISPSGVWSDGVRLVVATSRRVLVWTKFPTGNLQPADLVLGQYDFAHLNLPFDSGRSIESPWGVSSDGTSLAVTDSMNHRVVIWNTFPTVNGQQPDTILGVASLTERRPDSYQIDRGFDLPSGVLMLPTRTLVTDTNNNRVLIFRRPTQP